MPYSPDDSFNVIFDFADQLYVAPDSHAVIIDFDEEGALAQYLSSDGVDELAFGLPTVAGATSSLYPSGFDALNISNSFIFNNNKHISPLGVEPPTNTQKPTAYNLRKYVQLSGFAATSYGVQFAQGGVKYVAPNGLSSLIFGTTNVVNTLATQPINLSGKGILPPVFPQPVLSPRFLFPTGFVVNEIGSHVVQRNPSPIGFDSSVFGTAWASHNPRYVVPIGIDSFATGYPVVYDPTQKIYLDGAGISGGIFGDTLLKNTRRIAYPLGFASDEFSSFATISSNLRTVSPTGIIPASVGSNQIQNKSPSIAPEGFDAFSCINVGIGYSIRTVNLSGGDFSGVGLPVIKKPPAFNPIGFDASLFGVAQASNFTRTVQLSGFDATRFGESTAWFRYRFIQTDGLTSNVFGVGRIEHRVRTIEVVGTRHDLHGSSTIGYATRYILATSIYNENASNHSIGGSQYINAQGYVATLFGTRIIPESQSIYPSGATGVFGLSSIDLYTRHIKTVGFASAPQESADRFGRANFWNLRQFIQQDFDGGSGLVPPSWPIWTEIENRNKRIAAFGFNASLIGANLITNKARTVLPVGLNSFMSGRLLLAYRIRSLMLSGLPPTYIGGWSTIYNGARLINPLGFDAHCSGTAEIEVTRRYYYRIGNFESMAFGLPRISMLQQHLRLESRYSIEQKPVPEPKIELSRRYIEVLGADYYASGASSAHEQRNTITPRWSLKSLFGEAYIKNLTPELQHYGNNSNEFGQAKIRLQYRHLLAESQNMQLFGGCKIEFADRNLLVMGVSALAIGDKLKVTRMGAPPYSLQYIWLNGQVSKDDEDKIGEGYGIKPPDGQVAKPILNQLSVYPLGFDATKFGDVVVSSNGILVQPGYFELLVGSPAISLKNRTIQVGEFPDSGVFEPSKPSLSPHTIYAVFDAPYQAKRNNPSIEELHYVNSNENKRRAGEVFGHLVITLKNRRINPFGFSPIKFGDNAIVLGRQYIQLKGINSLRMGNATIPFTPQRATMYEPKDFMFVAKPTISHVRAIGVDNISPFGQEAGRYGAATISYFNREIDALGFNSLRMGASVDDDSPFMWKSLRVGGQVYGSYGGIDAQVFGESAISLKVREIRGIGFDSFDDSYSIGSFSKRMKVYTPEVEIPQTHIQAVGFVAAEFGVLNIKLAAHYIRPDGNAEQYRKGGW